MISIINIVSLTLPILLSGLTLIFFLRKNYLEFLNIPLDLHFKINGSRLFGDNKTYKGLLVFLTTSTIVSWTLKGLYLNGFESIIHSVFLNNPIRIGMLYAAAYTAGELINSAAKRQMKIAPGKVTKSNLKSLQKFVDLSDGIIMVALTLMILSLITFYQAISAATLGIGFHLVTDKIMQNLGLKEDFQQY